MKGLSEFFGIAFIVVILISSVSDGSIDVGRVVGNGVDFSMDLVEAAMQSMRASED